MIGDEVVGTVGIGKINAKFTKDVAAYIRDNHKHVAPGDLTKRQFLQYWLEWNGIVGYADDIMRLVEELEI